jgi:hypothetical protein
MVTTSATRKARIRPITGPITGPITRPATGPITRPATGPAVVRESVAVAELATVDELAGELMVADEMAP